MSEPVLIDVDHLAAMFRLHSQRMLGEFAPTVATSCEPDPPNGRLFLAEAKAQASVGEVRMIFGDREFEIRTSVKPTGRPWPLELPFYLRALNQDDRAASDSMWIHDEGRMLRVLAHQIAALQACLPELERDSRRLWHAAEEQRQASIVAGQARLRFEEMKVAVSRAAEAFRASDFGRVVSLLAPFSDILSEAQIQKLEMARVRLSSG